MLLVKQQRSKSGLEPWVGVIIKASRGHCKTKLFQNFDRRFYCVWCSYSNNHLTAGSRIFMEPETVSSQSQDSTDLRSSLQVWCRCSQLCTPSGRMLRTPAERRLAFETGLLLVLVLVLVTLPSSDCRFRFQGVRRMCADLATQCCPDEAQHAG